MQNWKKVIFYKNISYQIDGEHVQLNIENIEPEEAYFVEGTAKPMELDYEKIGRLISL